jgi:hypothetical protein
MTVQDKFRRGQIAGAKETVTPSKKSASEWEHKYPGIAKAAGAQRGGKYLKRIPKPGGGYRYIYKEEVRRPVTVRKVHEAIGQATGAINATVIDNIEKAEMALAKAKKADDPTNLFYDASSSVKVAQRALTKMSKTATATLNKYLVAKEISFAEGQKAIQDTENRISTYRKRLDKIERELDKF